MHHKRACTFLSIHFWLQYGRDSQKKMCHKISDASFFSCHLLSRQERRSQIGVQCHILSKEWSMNAYMCECVCKAHKMIIILTEYYMMSICCMFSVQRAIVGNPKWVKREKVRVRCEAREKLWCRLKWTYEERGKWRWRVFLSLWNVF